MVVWKVPRNYEYGNISTIQDIIQCHPLRMSDGKVIYDVVDRYFYVPMNVE